MTRISPETAHVEWTDEDYRAARDCMIGILRGHAWTISDGGRGCQEFDNAFQHAVGILSLRARVAQTEKEPDRMTVARIICCGDRCILDGTEGGCILNDPAHDGDLKKADAIIALADTSTEGK